MKEINKTDRDWTEDFPHENGNYSNICTRCGGIFFGHKRRVICRLCANRNELTYSDWKSLSEIKPPPEELKSRVNSGVMRGCWAEGEMVGYARCMIHWYEKVCPNFGK